MEVLKIHENDNLLVALKSLPAGTDVGGFAAAETIPAKHKLATEAIEPGGLLRLYGVTVARAREPIARGGLITTANVEHATNGVHARNGQARQWKGPDVSRWQTRTFDGFHRSDGRVGTANHWLVIPMVFCENRNIIKLREALLSTLGFANHSSYQRYAGRLVQALQEGRTLDDLALSEPNASGNSALFPNVDGVQFLTHSLGCGGTRQDADNLSRLLATYVDHPNVAGATVLSLGCQNAQLHHLQAHLRDINPRFDKPLHLLEQQSFVSEAAFLGEAIRVTVKGVHEADELQRAPAPLNQLCLGMECGASDGFSGISGNPVIGQVSDIAVALGGRSILGEFPELCGAEQELTSRCVTAELADRFVTLMRNYNAAAERVNSGFAFNPTEGNLRDGLITDAMKSCGAARKGGSSPVVDVQDYPGRITRPGLSLLCTPGNDVESTTALAGAGATLMLFSTGLGTPTGNPITPTIKVSTNSELPRRIRDMIDYDAGGVIDGSKTVESCGEELFELCLLVASGKETVWALRNGQADFQAWKRGVSL